jgi:hypothetical protein
LIKAVSGRWQAGVDRAMLFRWSLVVIMLLGILFRLDVYLLNNSLSFDELEVAFMLDRISFRNLLEPS